MVLKPISV